MKTKKITFWGFFQSKKTRLNGFCFLTELRKEEKSINLAKIFLFKKGDWNQSLFMECSFFFFSDQVSVFRELFFRLFVTIQSQKNPLYQKRREKNFLTSQNAFHKICSKFSKIYDPHTKKCQVCQMKLRQREGERLRRLSRCATFKIPFLFLSESLLRPDLCDFVNAEIWTLDTLASLHILHLLFQNASTPTKAFPAPVATLERKRAVLFRQKVTNFLLIARHTNAYRRWLLMESLYRYSNWEA